MEGEEAPVKSGGGKKMVWIIIVIAVIIVAVGGFLVWKFVLNKSTSGSGNSSSGNSSSAVADATKTACMNKYHDSDLCEFMANESVAPFDKRASVVTITGATDAQGSIVMKNDGKGNSSFTMNSGNGSINTIEYGGHEYMQMLAGGPWTDYGTTPTTSAPDANLTSLMSDLANTKFTKVGSEACGSLTCLKYQITESTVSGAEYLWIDTSQHLMREYSLTGTDGTNMDMKVDYQSVTITMPSPVQSLNATSGQ